MVRQYLFGCFSQVLGVYFCVAEHFSGAKLLDTLGDERLVGRLWNHEERDTFVETLAHTIHTAMRDKECGTPQDQELRPQRFNNILSYAEHFH